MATGESDRFDGGRRVEYAPATVGGAIRRFGVGLVLLAVVPTLVAGVGVVATSGVGGAVTAATTGGGEFATAFRVSVGVATAGCWCAGLGLLFEGLFAADEMP